jgi:hypothetical protein
VDSAEGEGVADGGGCGGTEEDGSSVADVCFSPEISPDPLHSHFKTNPARGLGGLDRFYTK